MVAVVPRRVVRVVRRCIRHRTVRCGIGRAPHLPFSFLFPHLPLFCPLLHCRTLHTRGLFYNKKTKKNKKMRLVSLAGPIAAAAAAGVAVVVARAWDRRSRVLHLCDALARCFPSTRMPASCLASKKPQLSDASEPISPNSLRPQRPTLTGLAAGWRQVAEPCRLAPRL